jgi:hypothetical protein
VRLPNQIFEWLGPLGGYLQPIVSATAAGNGQEFMVTTAWILLLLLVALVLPNSLHVMAAYEPALGIKPSADNKSRLAHLFNWRPTVPWAVAMAVLAGIAVTKLGGKSEFLYWQF